MPFTGDGMFEDTVALYAELAKASSIDILLAVREEF
jgi:hypothetical protein